VEADEQTNGRLTIRPFACPSPLRAIVEILGDLCPAAIKLVPVPEDKRKRLDRYRGLLGAPYSRSLRR